MDGHCLFHTRAKCPRIIIPSLDRLPVHPPEKMDPSTSLRPRVRLAIAGEEPVRSTLLPLSRPWLDEAEAAAAADAVRSGSLIGGGPRGVEVEAALAAVLDGVRPLFLNSCTSALEAAVVLAGAGPGDDVVVPSFTFVSCGNAVVRAGARPVFADLDPATLNISPASIARVITPRTRAIIVVHYAGRACDMPAILELADRRGVKVIEDAAHALGARLDGRPLGTIGDFGCFSFHGTKDVVCGEGGALVCRRDEDRRRAEIWREKGTNRAAFLRGEVDKYTWVSEGSSLIASDVLASILRVQIARLPAILARKRQLAARLTAALEPIASRVTLPREWPGIESSWHLYPVLVPTGVRDDVLRALRAENIGASFHYVPLHDSPFARERFGDLAGTLPETERVSASLVRPRRGGRATCSSPS
jgi:dTDP-4-amino-4,6-dideoxygalactose transaminase